MNGRLCVLRRAGFTAVPNVAEPVIAARAQLRSSSAAHSRGQWLIQVVATI